MTVTQSVVAHTHNHFIDKQIKKILHGKESFLFFYKKNIVGKGAEKWRKKWRQKKLNCSDMGTLAAEFMHHFFVWKTEQIYFFCSAVLCCWESACLLAIKKYSGGYFFYTVILSLIFIPGCNMLIMIFLSHTFIHTHFLIFVHRDKKYIIL